MQNNVSKSPVFSKKRDFIILGAVLIVAALFTLWFYVLKDKVSPDKELKYAWIYYENTLIEKVPLDGEEREWQLEIPDESPKAQEVDIIVKTFSDKTIAVMHSNCPDKVCVNTGRVGKAGQSIACLPNHVIIKIGTKDEPAGPGLDR